MFNFSSERTSHTSGRCSNTALHISLKTLKKLKTCSATSRVRLLPKNKNGYSDRLALLGLEALELPRLKFDLKMYNQIIHHSSTFLKILIVTHETRSHEFQLQKQVFQNNTLNNSFANRVIDFWNNLQNEIAETANYMITVESSRFVLFQPIL